MDRTLADAQARARNSGADLDAVNAAFAIARDCLSEAREIVRETRRELAYVHHEWEQFNRRHSGPGRYPDVAAPVVPDPPGMDLCPDPRTATTAVEFMATLRTYRIWAGEPSYRAMENVIKNQCSQRYSDSTIHAALKNDALPALAMVQAIITACGGSSTHQQMFTSAWRRLTMAQPDAAQASPPLAIYPVGETA